MLSVHMYGCRVIQKVLSKFNIKDSKRIVEFLTSKEQFHNLVLDQFGNYLIQTVLELSKEVKESPDKVDQSIQSLYEDARLTIYAHLHGQIVTLSCHKFASNVIEKVLL
jgi:pumilio RNA-binding family